MTQLSCEVRPSRDASRSPSLTQAPTLIFPTNPGSASAPSFRNVQPSSEGPRTIEITDSMVLTGEWRDRRPREDNPTHASAMGELAEGTVIKGRYEIIAFLNHGGIGQVYSARDLDTERIVAVKIAHPTSYAGDSGKFMRRESEALSSIDHENVVRYIDSGVHSGRSYIVMEYVDGPDLLDKINSRGLGFDEAIGIIEQLCDALDATHGKGIVHRDLKIDNILLDRSGNVKLADFGIAAYEWLPEDLASPGAVLGTPAYMAPEQCMGSTCTRGIDVHAVGVILYYMMTGEHPFMLQAMRERTLDLEAPGRPVADNEAARTMERILTMSPPAPSALSSGLPHELDAIVERAMAKSPEERYQDIMELKSDIKAMRGRLRDQ
ncbi:MAG: serine/threonine-protein kinase [Candidatus Micrarchaeota archaeon]